MKIMKKIALCAKIASFAVPAMVVTFFAANASAAEIKVVTSGAFTAAYLQLAPEFERTTHNKLDTGFGPSLGTTKNAIPVRLARGETIDLVIMASPGS